MHLGLNQRLGLSRNKVAVPEGVAGTPPFWSTVAIICDEIDKLVLAFLFKILGIKSYKLKSCLLIATKLESAKKTVS